MFDNKFQEYHGFYSAQFEIDHNHQLIEKSSIGNPILT